MPNAVIEILGQRPVLQRTGSMTTVPTSLYRQRYRVRATATATAYIADGGIVSRDQWYEGFRAWQHLGNAGMVEGQYAGTSFVRSYYQCERSRFPMCLLAALVKRLGLPLGPQRQTGGSGLVLVPFCEYVHPRQDLSAKAAARC